MRGEGVVLQADKVAATADRLTLSDQQAVALAILLGSLAGLLARLSAIVRSRGQIQWRSLLADLALVPLVIIVSWAVADRTAATASAAALISATVAVLGDRLVTLLRQRGERLLEPAPVPAPSIPVAEAAVVDHRARPLAGAADPRAAGVVKLGNAIDRDIEAEGDDPGMVEALMRLDLQEKEGGKG